MVPNPIAVVAQAYRRRPVLGWFITRGLAFGTGYYVLGQGGIGKIFENKKQSTLQALEALNEVDKLVDAAERRNSKGPLNENCNFAG